MSNLPYGVVEIAGKQYLERWQIIPFQLTVSVDGYTNPTISIQLPGTYDFRLKALTRETIVNGEAVERRFLSRIGNTDGGQWYAQGVGGGTDRVLDTLLYGNAQFPYPVIPTIFFSRNGAILLDFQDISNDAPYIINFGFHGAYLIPVG